MSAVALRPATVPLPGGGVDLVRGDVVRDGQVCARLTPRDLELLAYLIEHAGEDLPRERLATEVLGQRPGAVSRAVDSAVFRLRSKLERDPAQPVSLITVQGHGYRWVPAAPAAAPPTLPAPREELVQTPALWGRIDAAMAASGRCVLVGPPGIGKSTAAIAWARARPQPAGAVLVEVGREAVVGAVARALGVPTGERGTERAVGHALAGRGAVLVIVDTLDGADRGLTEVVEHWRADAPEARWLITSRTRPAGADVVEVGPLSVDEGVALFLTRARAVRAELAVGADGDVQALVRALDGVPLAIELAASRIGAFSPAQLLDRLPGGLRLLDGRGPRAGLRGAIEQSWAMLSPEDQRSFARLSVFARSFGAEAARAVIAEGEPEPSGSTDVLARLVRCSLLVDEGGGFRLLQSLRAFAAERLAERPDDRRDAFRRHALWFTRGAEDLLGEALAPGRDAAARLARERDDVWLAVERLERDDPHLAGRAAAVASPAGLRAEHDEAIERITLDLAERLVDDAGVQLALRFALQRSAASVRRRQGRFDDATAVLDRAARLAEALNTVGPDGPVGPGAVRARVRVMADRCGLLIAASRLEEGVRWGEAARAEAERVRDEPLLGIVLADLAVGLKQLGRTAEAVSSYERALALLERTGNETILGLALGNVGVLDAERGRTDLARQRFEAAAAIHLRTGNVRSGGVALLNLGLLDDEEGDTELALHRYHQALDVMIRTGSRRFEGLCRANLGGALGRTGRPVAARQQLRRAKQIALDLDLPRDAAVADGEAGIAAWAEGERSEAIRLLRSAAALPAAPRYEALYRGFLGALLGLEGDPAAGLAELALASAAAERAEDPSLPPVLARMEAILAGPDAPRSLPPAGRGWWGRYADQRLREVRSGRGAGSSSAGAPPAGQPR
jgi:predicted ATPase